MVWVCDEDIGNGNSKSSYENVTLKEKEED